jgi:hypothetical protein
VSNRFTFQGLASLGKSSTKGRSTEVWTEGLKALQGLHYVPDVYPKGLTLTIFYRSKIETTSDFAT